jgi:hypothetical protein
MLVLYLSSEKIDGMFLFDLIRPKIPSYVQLRFSCDTTSLCRSSANLESLPIYRDEIPTSRLRPTAWSTDRHSTAGKFCCYRHPMTARQGPGNKWGGYSPRHRKSSSLLKLSSHCLRGNEHCTIVE